MPFTWKFFIFFWYYKKDTLQMFSITPIWTPKDNYSNQWGHYGISRPLCDHFLDFRGQWPLTHNNFKTNDFRFLKCCHNMQMIYGQFLEKCQLNQPTTYCQIFANSNEKIWNLPKKETKYNKKWHFRLKILKKLPGTITKMV